jgi:hypothetical protein
MVKSTKEKPWSLQFVTFQGIQFAVGSVVLELGHDLSRSWEPDLNYPEALHFPCQIKHDLMILYDFEGS